MSSLFRLTCILSAGLSSAVFAADLPTRATVEELYAGELDDTGPQYLLVSKEPQANRFVAWTHADVNLTDNATFSETNPRSSTVTSFQAGLDGRLNERALAGGKLAFDASARAQIFRYGLMDGPNKVIDFMQVGRNNFDLFGMHLRAAWQRGPWLVDSMLQGSLLRNRSAGRTFYRDLGWTAALYRQWKTGESSTLIVGGDLTRRWSWTDTYGLLPSSWNDRVEASLVAVWSHPLRPGLAWRSTARAHFAEYSHRDRHRSDITGTLGTELDWTLGKNLELRIFTSHERRNSSEAAIPDYARWDLGTGAGLRWSF
jgi:hypothetical protein